ncbi:unnamed protein product, partial [Chrysoparadoxa australica]
MEWVMPAAVTAMVGAASGRESYQAVGLADGTVLLWDVRLGQCRTVLPPHLQQVNTLALHGTRYLVSGGAEGTLHMVDLQPPQDAGELFSLIASRHDAEGLSIDQVLTLADPPLVVALDSSRRLAVMDLARGDLLGVIGSGEGGEGRKPLLVKETERMPPCRRDEGDLGGSSRALVHAAGGHMAIVWADAADEGEPSAPRTLVTSLVTDDIILALCPGVRSATSSPGSPFLNVAEAFTALTSAERRDANYSPPPVPQYWRGAPASGGLRGGKSREALGHGTNGVKSSESLRAANKSRESLRAANKSSESLRAANKSSESLRAANKSSESLTGGALTEANLSLKY